MGIFSGIFDAVGDVLGGIKDTVAPIVSSFIPGLLGGSTLPFMGSNDEYGVPSGMFTPTQIGSLFSAAGASLPTLLSGGLSMYGQSSANAANEAMADKQMAFQRLLYENAQRYNTEQSQVARNFNMSEASRARDWMADMSNTSWQRGVLDMKKAGLNPMLAFMKGGASSPQSSGASSAPASSPTVPGGASAVMLNAMSPGIQSAISASRALAEIDQIKADTSLKNAQSAVQAVTVPKLQQETLQSASATSLAQAQDSYYQKMTWVAVNQAEKILSEMALADAQKDKVRAEILNVVLSGGLIKAETASVQAQAVLRQLDIPRARNVEGAQSTWWMKNISPFIPDATRVINSGAAAARAGSHFQ